MKDKRISRKRDSNDPPHARRLPGVSAGLRLAAARFPGVEALYRAIVNPPPDQQLEAAFRRRRQWVPTLWLLGESGSGKSSIVRLVTGLDDVEIGGGFAPCTRYAQRYDYPPDEPVLRFLDTRGLGEPDYDPLDDLQQCQQSSHALLVLARIDNPAQSVLLETLATVLGTDARLPIIVAHTHLHTIPDTQARERAIRNNQLALEQVAGRALPSVAVDLSHEALTDQNQQHGRDKLINAIADLMPEVHALHLPAMHPDDEHATGRQLNSHILWYAGVAAASDAVPAIGLVTVPGIQGKMLHSLAQKYGVTWNRRRITELLTALGTSILYRYSLSLAGRQLGKFVPVYGQSVGAASAAAISFASTVALGRAACRYLHAVKHEQSIDADAIRNAYSRAMDRKSP